MEDGRIPLRGVLGYLGVPQGLPRNPGSELDRRRVVLDRVGSL
jgi:hypothetical protein